MNTHGKRKRRAARAARPAPPHAHTSRHSQSDARRTPNAGPPDAEAELARQLIGEALARQAAHAQPPPIVPLIGLEIVRAWLAPTHDALVLLFEGAPGSRPTLLAMSIPSPIEVEAAGALAIEFRASSEQPSTNWSALDLLGASSEGLRRLEAGRYKLVGMDRNVLAFQGSSGMLGARFKPSGCIDWVETATPVTT